MRYIADDAAAYERFLGRWTGRLAEALIDFAELPGDGPLLDVGCGTGSVALALGRRYPGRTLHAVDVSAAYVAFAKGREGAESVQFEQADAAELPFKSSLFSASIAQLALNFTRDSGQAAQEMRRVTRSGGVAAAAVWDFRGGLVYQRLFWDTAALIDREAGRTRDRLFSHPLAQPEGLVRLWQEIGLRDIDGASLTIRMNYRGFDDYWEPLLGGQGPFASYVAGPVGGAPRRDPGRRARCVLFGLAGWPAFAGRHRLGRARACAVAPARPVPTALLPTRLSVHRASAICAPQGHHLVQRARQCGQARVPHRTIRLAELCRQALRRPHRLVADAIGWEQDDVGAAHDTSQPRDVVVDAAVVMQKLAGAALDQRAPVCDLSRPRADDEDARAGEVRWRRRYSGEAAADGGTPVTKLTLRVDFSDGTRLGPGKVRLLELIGEQGSISAAGRGMGMSYRRAWLLVDSLNQCFREPLVQTQHGGRGGGGAGLSSFGRMIVETYRAMEREAATAVAPRLHVIEQVRAERSPQ